MYVAAGENISYSFSVSAMQDWWAGLAQAV
jgi:hypothetical protein